jgi:hypothetical protein
VNSHVKIRRSAVGRALLEVVLVAGAASLVCAAYESPIPAKRLLAVVGDDYWSDYSHERSFGTGLNCSPLGVRHTSASLFGLLEVA